MEARAGVRGGEERAEALTDQRLEDLERFRDVDYAKFREDIERRFAEAFPGADHVGHCRYHTLMIEDIDSRKKLRQAVVEKTISGLVWGAVVGIGAAVWNYYFKSKGAP